LDSVPIKTSLLEEQLASQKVSSAAQAGTQQACVLAGYLFPPQMTLRGWKPEAGEITVVVGVPGDLQFEEFLHKYADLRHLMAQACNEDRPIGDKGSKLGKLRSSLPSTLKPDLIADGFTLNATPLGGYTANDQTVSKTHYALWRWTVTPGKEEPSLVVRFAGGSTDQYILPIEIQRDWTWYLSKFWAWIIGIASGIAVLAKWKTVLDWIGLKKNKDSDSGNRNDGTDEV
jgi:hypothetical protein